MTEPKTLGRLGAFIGGAGIAGAAAFLIMGTKQPVAPATQQPAPAAAASTAVTPDPQPPEKPRPACDLPPVWQEGDAVSDVRSRAWAEAVRWTGNSAIAAKNRCEVDAKTDTQLAADEKVAAEQATAAAARERVEQAHAEREEAEREKREAVEAAKKQKEEAEEERRSAKEHADGLRAGIRSGEIKALDAHELAVQTHKWDDQQIVATLSCYYADAADYRCTAGRVRVDFSSFAPAAAEEKFKANCDTLKKSIQRACSLRIVFTYDGFDEMDMGAGLFGGRLAIVQALGHTGEIIAR